MVEDFMIVIWILIGLATIALGPTRLTYACVWVMLICTLILQKIGDRYEKDER